MENIVVIGSTNMDLINNVENLPKRGETIIGWNLATSLGGKGMNQAVACSRLGAHVTFVTCVGKDDNGQKALSSFVLEGINIDHVIETDQAPTGIALITVDRNGDNTIVVIPGANHLLTPEDVEAAEKVIMLAKCVLIQLEIPLRTVEKAVEIASKHGVHVILNPAPAVQLPSKILEKVNTLTPNETEVSEIFGSGKREMDLNFLKCVDKSYSGNLVVTLGEKGAMEFNRNQTIYPVPEVVSVDTTAAGDTFNAALAVSISEGLSIERAIQYANAAAALSVTKRGAIDSLPTSKEVEVFLNRSMNK